MTLRLLLEYPSRMQKPGKYIFKVVCLVSRVPLEHLLAYFREYQSVKIVYNFIEYFNEETEVSLMNKLVIFHW